ncbi:MAG TPA: DUF742 domain-containing protein [Acidimicrobiia bacterium]|nr:DUF742 domain-containing protein [Acidimicrobiia bacterium]
MADDPAAGRFVRPYAITGGRTDVDLEIELETQIEATARGVAAQSRYRWEAARVIEVCRRPVALVEIAAALSLPIGVVRVVVADLENDGAVGVHRPNDVDLDSASYTELLERVLEGIRSL